MSEPTYVAFGADVKVHDPEALRIAAASKAVMEGMSPEQWADLRGDIVDDLIMLLDPGSIPGAGIEIVQSYTEILNY